MDTQEDISGGEGGEILPISTGVTADSLAQKQFSKAQNCYKGEKLKDLARSQHLNRC